ncbi:MAG: antiviral reverse transcriptase Drt5 [Zavarzinella sp.]
MTSTVNFFERDFAATLFPLKTNLLLVQKHSTEISDYIYQRVLNNSHPEDNFLPQQRVYATKPRDHLRRTAKLDPVAEYFLYDVVYRNRGVFRPEVSELRRSFGYRFVNGQHIPVHHAYAQYKQELAACWSNYSHNIQFDIASYFNSMYHHDVAHWFEEKTNASSTDSAAFSKFCREINSGRSIDFMPHGIYPAKMIGNEFLKSVDLYGPLKSHKIVRFMDDFSLFDNDPYVLKKDFQTIQTLLGQYALNINPSKTAFDVSSFDLNEKLTELRESLKEIITEYVEIPTASGVEFAEIVVELENSLRPEQVEALLGLLQNDSLEESDADRILSFLRLHSDNLLAYLPMLFMKFPNLIKHIHSVCGEVREKASLSEVILKYLKTSEEFLEYQLFWIGAIVEDHLLGHGCFGEILLRLYELTPNLKIARAKVLEIPIQEFGFKEIRREYLKTGQSDWLSWSSAVGSQSLKPGERNYVLSYFANASPMNFLISEGVKKCI